MFPLLTLATQVLANAHNLTDKDSWRNFLKELAFLIRTRAMESKIRLDETELKHIEFTLNNHAMFDCVYRLIAEQLQTPEILFESADDDALLESIENAMPTPEAIDPILIVSLVSQIISLINTIKANRNR